MIKNAIAFVTGANRGLRRIYVVGEERDLVRVRTNYRGEEVYLYRIQATPAAARRLFEIYLTRINSLADHPEWYHLLKSNCTLDIVRYAYATGGQEGSFDIRHFLNGWTDQFLYEKKLVIASIPFDALRSRSRINEAAQATPDASEAWDFARAIRASLPGEPPQRD
jgi:hypothetical protein